jgi:hypothetical protein
MALGYLDIYFAPTLLLALWALKAKKLVAFTVLFSIACLTKWQPLVIAPFLLFHVLEVNTVRDLKRVDYRRFSIQVMGPCLAIIALVLIVYGGAPILALKLALVNEHNPYLSGNALNFSWVLTHFLHVFSPETFGGLVDGRANHIKTDDLGVTLLPKILFAVSYATVLFAFLRRKNTFENVIRYAFVGFLAYFTFNTGVHENHLFAACLLAAVAFLNDRNQGMTFVTWSIVANVNIFLFYGLDGRGLPFERVVGFDSALMLALVNVGLFVELWLRALRDDDERCCACQNDQNGTRGDRQSPTLGRGHARNSE